MNAIESTNAQPVANLRESKKELAAAKKPAPAKAPARKAPAKKAAAKSSTKIRWTADGEKDAKGDCPATGTVGDRTYKITKAADGTWKATVKVGSKTTVVAENAKTGRACWAACVKDAKSAVAA
jgi:hypothetical protein